MRKREEGPAGKSPSRPLLAGLVLVALLTVSCGAGGRAENSGGDERAVAAQAVADLGHPSLGEEDAPVVLIEYSDFQ